MNKSLRKQNISDITMYKYEDLLRARHLYKRLKEIMKIMFSCTCDD